jgi:hypothetical protein
MTDSLFLPVLARADRFPIIRSARRPSLGSARARCVARRLDLLRATAGALITAGGQSLAIPGNGLPQGGAGLIVGEPVLHAQTIECLARAVAGSVAGVLPCAR